MWKQALFVANLAVVLTACSGKPTSYLPTGQKPIVNIDAVVAPMVDVRANPEQLAVRNLSDQALAVSYKLFWYDAEGVSQGLGAAEKTAWQPLWLAPKEKQNLALAKPSEESVNYRFYLRGRQ